MKDLTIDVSWLITILLFIFTAINFFNGRKSETTRDAEQDIKVNMKLDEICRTTNETRSDIKSMKNEIKDVREEQIKQKMQIEALWKDVDVLKSKEG